MKRLFLHIGRHKCGTTSIQKTLYQNRAKLLESGFYYPETGIRVAAHHVIAEVLGEKNLSLGEGDRANLSQELKDEIQATNCRNIIISSEGLQSCNPSVVHRFFQEFEDIEVVPVCYLREQAAYLRSSYLQKVHATNYTGSIEQFYQAGFATDYRIFLEKWKAVFKTDFHIRLFDRASLIDGDAVTDFLIAILGLTREEITKLEILGDENPSLSREMLAFKLEYNSRDLPNNGQIYFGLGKLSKEDGSKYEIPLAITQDVRSQYSASNKWVEENFLSEGQQFSYPLYDEVSLENVSAEQFDAIFQDLDTAKKKEMEQRERRRHRQEIRQLQREKAKLERQKERQKERRKLKAREKREKGEPGLLRRIFRAFHRRS